MNFNGLKKEELTISIEIVYRWQLCEEKRAIYNFANDYFFLITNIKKNLLSHIGPLFNSFLKIDYFLSGKIIIFSGTGNGRDKHSRMLICAFLMFPLYRCRKYNHLDL